MLRPLCALLAVVSVALGVYAWVLNGDVSLLRGQLAALEGEKNAARKAEADARHEVAAVRESEDKEAAAKLAANTPLDGAPGALSANAGGPPKKPADGANPMQAMAKMFQTEDGKKMMKAQFSMLTKMQYGDLLKALKLDPEQSEQLLNLLTERTSSMAGNPFKLMSEGGLDEAALKKMGEDNAASRKNYDAMIKNALGEDGYAKFKDYEGTIGERMALSQMEPMINAGGTPLAPEQHDKLLQIMGDERKKSPPSVFDPTGRDAVGNLKAMNDDAAVDQWFKQEEDYRQRVLKQASTILSPEQTNSVQQAFSQLAQMQKFGISMSKGMLKNNGGQAPAPPVAAPK